MCQPVDILTKHVSHVDGDIKNGLTNMNCDLYNNTASKPPVDNTAFCSLNIIHKLAQYNILVWELNICMAQFFAF